MEQIFTQMDSLKKLYADELGKEIPDTLELKKIANEMGNYHAKIKYISGEHFIQTKRLCNPEQKIKLHKIFTEKINPCKPNDCRMKP